MIADRNNKKADTLNEALTRFVNAYVQGEQPDIDEFVEQYPQYEAQIRQRVRSLREIDALLDSIIQTDESDFGDMVAEPDLVGRRIGDFEIVAIVGRGGMGVVYRARDTRLDRTVAIKSIPAGLVDSSTARMRFRREAKLLASLNHPNIGVIYDIIEQNEGTGYLILEYVPGQTLTERVAGEPLNVEQALSIGRQVAEAISAAHKKGIVHRDLKPGNIKITPDGQVKVLDFGLAKPHTGETENAEATATQRHHIMGTPAYMSPEQARGQSADHRTDIWSFGCVLYQMLTARLPFEGKTTTDMLARIIEREPDWDALPKNVPPRIRDMLCGCLEKDPGQRLGNISDVRAEIDKALVSPSKAGPITIFANLQKKAMVISLGVIACLSVFAVWSTLFRPEPPATQSIDAGDFDAEDYYQQGNKLFSSRGVVDTLKAIKAYEKAIELDPDMALAYAELTRAHLNMYMQSNHTEERRMKAERALNEALRLGPDLFEVYRARGQYYYHGELRYDRALEQFDVARQMQPDDANIWGLIGAVQRRKGDFEQALDSMQQACDLDPLNGVIAGNLSETLKLMRRFKDAEEAYDRVVGLNPNLRYPYHFKAWLRVYGEGDISGARKIIDEAFQSGISPDDDNIADLLAEIDFLDRKFEDALKRRINAKGVAWDTQHQYIPKALHCALVSMHTENGARTREYFEEARTILEKKKKEYPGDPRFVSSLGIAYAGLGLKEEALRNGNHGYDMCLIEKDAMRGPYRLEDFARIYMMVGEHERAIDRLEQLLGIPSRITPLLLQMDPTWDPLRYHPRFKELVEKSM